MPTDIRFVLPNQPGRFQRVLQALAQDGINLDGAAGDLRPGETWGVVHILVDDPARITEILEELGVEVSSQHEVQVHEIEDRPGALAEVLQTYAEKEDNVEVIYTASNNRIVVGTETMRTPVAGVRTKDARYT